MHRHLLPIALLGFVVGRQAAAADWPMLGRDGTRNSVSSEKDAPVRWRIEQHRDERLIREAKGLRWTAKLGTAAFGSPVVSGGLVWIGTNNQRPGVKSDKNSGSALFCFRATDGRFIYEYVSPKLGTANTHDAGWAGLGSSPLIEGDRLWIATNRSEVVCLDIGPLQRGEGDPRELWKLDMVKEFDIFPRAALMGPPRPCSIGPSWKGRIFVTTNNGVDLQKTVPKPNAPSLVCLDKETGKVYWTDNSPGENILLTQFASPTQVEIDGRLQVIVPQSDGWVRSFDGETGKKLWEFDINPKTARYEIRGIGSGNTLLGNAVAYEGRVYVAAGNYPENGDGIGRLVCIDPTRRGDVSSELAVNADGKLLPRRRWQAVDEKEGEKAVPNPNSAVVWEFVRCGKDDFLDTMHRSVGAVAIAEGLLVSAGFPGIVHCLDAKTGKRYWSHDLLSSVWATPLIVDDKVYVADEDGNVTVFQFGRDPRCGEPLATVEHDSTICSSPVYADGTLYVANRNRLFAVDAGLSRRFEDEIAKWTQWRGPIRDNRSKDTGLLSSWPEGGPPLAWRVDGLGDGIASVAVVDDRVFTCTTYDASEYAVALDEATGERHWATRVGTAVGGESPLMRWLSQRTPTVDGNRVYVFTRSGWLVCLNTIDGSIVWRVSYPHEFAAAPGRWGYCDRPLVDGERLVCVPGGKTATLAVLDKRTGKSLWTKLLEDRESSSYGAPLIVDTDGLKQYVVFLENSLVSFAADDGRVLWRYDRISNGIANSYTPIVLDDGLLCANGYGRGGIARLNLTRRDNEVVAKEAYFQAEILDPFEDSTVVVDGRLYAFNFGGLLQCFDVADGKRLWGPIRGPRGKAAATYADGHLYIRNADGDVRLVQANPAEYVAKGHFQLDEPRKGVGSTFPVVAGGRLYVRDNDRLYCYDVTDHGPNAAAPKANVVALKEPREAAKADRKKLDGPNAIFVPTPHDVVERMLTEAGVQKEDVVYDLGSGDGRIVLAAASTYGCRAVGLEIDRDLVSLSKEEMREAKAEKLVTIREADIFAADFKDATVVAVYLYPRLLQRLLPKFDQLKPGSRIVSHQFAFPDVPPVKEVAIESKETGAKHTIYVWTTPLRKPAPAKQP